MDGTNVEAECFPGPHRPTAREQRIQGAIRFFSFLQNRCHFAPVNGGLVLLIHLWKINEFVVPVSHEERLAPHVSRRSHHGFDDIHVVASRRRRQQGNMINELFHGEVGDVGQIPLTEEGLHPLVQGVSPCVDRRLFEWIALAVGKRL